MINASEGVIPWLTANGIPPLSSDIGANESSIEYIIGFIFFLIYFQKFYKIYKYIIIMDFKEWFQSKPYWLKGLIIGTIYPIIIILLIILSNLPFAGFIFNILLNILIYPALLLSNIFSYLILKIFYPGYIVNNILINRCTNLFKCSGECYSLFRFCYLTIPAIFSFIIAWVVGAIIGLIVGRIKTK